MVTDENNLGMITDTLKNELQSVILMYIIKKTPQIKLSRNRKEASKLLLCNVFFNMKLSLLRNIQPEALQQQAKQKQKALKRPIYTLF